MIRCKLWRNSHYRLSKCSKRGQLEVDLWVRAAAVAAAPTSWEIIWTRSSASTKSREQLLSISKCSNCVRKVFVCSAINLLAKMTS